MTFEPTSIRGLLHFGEEFLVTRDVPNARRNTEWILGHVLGCRSTDLYLQPDSIPPPERVASFRTLIERRGAREPLQYILESTEFMGLPFVTSPGVLIPRPDTEVLVETVERLVGNERGAAIETLADLGCGSGVIAVSLVRRCERLRAVAVDKSRDAAALTARNAVLNGVGDRIEVVEADASEFLGAGRNPFDVIVSNPPYIPTGDIPDLPTEVRGHEPLDAIDGGPDGLGFYRAVVRRMAGAVRPGGLVALEIGFDQAAAVTGMLSEAAFERIRTVRDYNGLDRVVTAHRPR